MVYFFSVEVSFRELKNLEVQYSKIWYYAYSDSTLTTKFYIIYYLKVSSENSITKVLIVEYLERLSIFSINGNSTRNCDQFHENQVQHTGSAEAL